MSSSSPLSRLFGGAYRRLARRRSHLRSSLPAAPDQRPSAPAGPQPMRSPNRGLGHDFASLFEERDLDRLVSRFKEASASSPRFRSRHRIYEITVRRLAAAGRLDAVADILEAQKRHPGDFTREGFAVRIIGLYGRAGMAAAAGETFRELPALGCRPTVLSFNALLSACVHAGEFERVDELFRLVPAENSEIVPDRVSYTIVISSMCKRGDLDGALCMLEVMEERGVQPTLVTFNTLLNGCYSKGRSLEADKVYAKMAEKNCAPDVKSFNAKLRWLVLEGRTSEAVELVGQFPSMGIKPDTFTFNALIKGHCQDGNLDDAKKVFDSLTKNDCRPNCDTFETLVPALCQSGQLDVALHMCKESVSRKCHVKAEVLQRVVDGLYEDSRFSDAEKLVGLAQLHCYNGKSVRMPSFSAKAS